MDDAGRKPSIAGEETICVNTCGTFYRHEEGGNEEKTTDLKPPKLAGK